MKNTGEKIRSEIAAVDREIADLQRRKSELLIALRVVEALDGTSVAKTPGPTLSAAEKRTLVLELLGSGSDSGRTPSEIHADFERRGIRTVNADNIRTILWRMAKRGEIGAKYGVYWKHEVGASGV